MAEEKKHRWKGGYGKGSRAHCTICGLRKQDTHKHFKQRKKAKR